MDSKAPEIEDYSNRWLFHPISDRLAVALSKTWVHPNVVSFTGVFFGILAGINYYHYDTGNSAIWAFLYMLVWHVLDGTDGHLARLTGKATATGRAIDGLADHLVYLAVYLGMAFAIYERGNPHIIWIVLLAGASHAIQASMLDRERQTYRFWVYSGLAGTEPKQPPKPKNKFLLGLHIYFQFIAELFDSNEPIKHMAHEMKLNKSQKQKAANYYRREYVDYLHVWSIQSPNSHTFAIFVFAFFGAPLGYFLFEILILNFILMIFLIWKRDKDKAFKFYLKTLEK